MATNVELVTQLYVGYFGRAPDGPGLQGWVDQLNAGQTTLIDIGVNFSKSQEARAKYPYLSTPAVSDPAAYVNAVYQNILGRDADTGGRDYWVGLLKNPPAGSGFTAANFVQSFIDTINKQTSGTDAATLANKVASGIYYTQQTLAKGAPYQSQQAFDSVQKVTSDQASVTAQKAATDSYANNAAGGAGTSFNLTTGIDSGTAFTGGTGADTFNATNLTFNASDNLTGGDGKDTLNITDTGTSAAFNPAGTATGIEVISLRNINGTAGTPAVTETAAITFQALAAGQTITIAGRTVTAGSAGALAVDVATAFLSGNTTAVNSANVANQTATPSGTLTNYTGSATGSTSANLSSTIPGNVSPDATNSGTGTVSIQITQGSTGTQAAGFTDTIAAGNFTGATEFQSNLSTGAVAVTGLIAGQAISLVGNGSVANGALSGAYGATVTAGTINVVGGTTGTAGITLTGVGLTSAAINSSGAANSVGTIDVAGAKAIAINATSNLTATSITTSTANSALTVSGSAAKVNVGTLNGNITTVDASGLTAGGITATLNTGVTSFKGGAGGDVVTTAASTAASAVIDGGSGSTDTLVLAASNDIGTTAKGAQYVNFENLKSLQTNSFNASLVSGITAVESAAAGAGFTNLTAAQAAAITISTSQTAVTYALANATGTSDVVGITLANTTAGVPATTIVNATGLTLTGFETVNLTASSGLNNVNLLSDGVTAAVAGTNYDQFKFAAAGDATTVTLAGAFAAQVDISSGAAKVAVLDASANTAGADLVTGGQSAGLTVTGTAAADKITLGTVSGGSQVVNSGGGNDLITGSQAVIAAATINGGAGTDTLTFTDSSLTINDNTFRNVSAIEKIVAGATNGTDLNFTVGGFANAIATANGGVLDFTAAKLASSGAVTVDASGLTGSNSLKLNLTDTAGTGVISIVSSQGGADSITLKTVTSHTTNITVNASGNTAGVTIDASGLAAGAGTNTLTGGTGADTIKGGTVAETIKGGAGADNITLLSGHSTAQTLLYNDVNQSTTTASDSVTNFVFASDILKVTSTTILNTAQLGSTGWTVSGGIASKTGAVLSDFVSAFAASTTAGEVGFVYNGDTYVAISDGTAATTTGDQIVKLVGLSTTTALGTAAAATTVVLST